MERFAAMVAGRRAAPARAPASAEEEEVEEEKGKGKEDEACLSIHLEEIVVVKNEDIIARPCTAHGGNTLGFGGVGNSPSLSASMEQCAKAAAAPPAGSSTAAAARGAWTTVARIVGFD